MSALLGAMLLVVADLGARTVNPPKELAIGIMVALVGVPFFLYIARKVGRSYSERSFNTDKKSYYCNYNLRMYKYRCNFN